MPQNTLKLKQSQQLVLTPQMQQSINILGMNHLALSVEIEHMLSQNFMLETNQDGLSEIEMEYSPDDIDHSLDYDDKDLWADCEEDWPTQSNDNSSISNLIPEKTDLPTSRSFGFSQTQRAR